MSLLQFRRLLPALLLFLSVLPGWAGPINAAGVPNLYQVNEHLYRGAQPSTAGWRSLADLGIRVVVDLRRENEAGGHSIGAEARAVEAAGMRYVSIPMNGLAAPSDDQIARILAVFDSGEPVFVHCRRGKDRTGTAIACYRIAHDHWRNAEALAEAKSLGLHWIETAMKRYIMAFAGLRESAPGTVKAAVAGQ